MSIDQMTIDAILGEVARRSAVTVPLLYAQDRRVHVARARHTAFLALNFAGLCPAEISRALAFNHSTVVHGLGNAKRDEGLVEIARTASSLAGDQHTAVAAWLAHDLRWLPPHAVAAVQAYAACTLLCWVRRAPTQCVYGLQLLTDSPRVRAALDRTLARCDLSPFITHIDLHIRQAGYQRGA